jgi:hypothetical protein
MGGFEHIAIPSDEHVAELEYLDHGSCGERIPMNGADPIAFDEGLMFIRHGLVEAMATRCCPAQ